MESFQSRGRHVVFGNRYNRPLRQALPRLPFTQDIIDYVASSNRNRKKRPPTISTKTRTKTKTKSNFRRKSGRTTKPSKSSCATACIPICQNKVLPKCMAKRRVSRKTRRPRRRYRRRARVPIGIPDHKIVKLKTTCYSSVDAGAGTIYVNTLKLSSAKDPTGTFTSNQPLYHTQYSTMYNRYVVLGYKVSVQAVSSDNTNPIVVGFTPVVDSTGLTDWKHYREIKGTTQKILTSDVDRTWFTVKGSIKRFLEPQGGSLLTDNDVQSAVTADPQRMLHGHIYCQAMDSTANPSAVHFIVTVTQIVKYFVPVIPSAVFAA